MENNWKDFFKDRRKEIIFLASTGFAIFILILFVGLVYEGPGIYVPEGFIDMRGEAIDLSADIADLSNKINQSYEQISAKDRIGDYVVALSLMEENTPKREKIQSKLASLLDVLDAMAKDVEDIRPSSLKKIGKETVSTNIKMVERLIAYHNLNENLIDAIRAKLVEGSNQEIQPLIDKINDEVRFINSISQSYLLSIQQFDQLTDDNL
ncbi:hypothetical protein KKH05_00945 [Patescibacteria group bacterium]|nr:hypothetical protein [Patescibacteria group bacterium]